MGTRDKKRESLVFHPLKALRASINEGFLSQKDTNSPTKEQNLEPEMREVGERKVLGFIRKGRVSSIKNDPFSAHFPSINMGKIRKKEGGGEPLICDYPAHDYTINSVRYLGFGDNRQIWWDVPSIIGAKEPDTLSGSNPDVFGDKNQV